MKKHPDFVDGGEILLKNVEVRYPYLIEPDTKFKAQWSMEILLDENVAKSLKEIGANVKTNEHGPFIKVKKLVFTRKGIKQKPPIVVGRDGKTRITEEIGSGSIVNVKLWAKYVTVEGETCLALYLNAVQVVTLEEPNSTGFEDLGEDNDNNYDDIPF